MAAMRHQARIIALQALYEVETAGHKAAEVLTRLLEASELTEESAAFARELVNGVLRNQEKIDENIKEFAPAWPLEQMMIIDRNILRLAIFEILLDNEVSVKIAINEAVELAKEFGGDSSSSFVNGVLGSISNLAGR